MQLRGKSSRVRLMFTAALGALVVSTGVANAQESRTITIAPQSLASALYEFGGQTGRQVMFTPDVTAAKTTGGVSAATDEQTALAQLLQGTGLTFRREANVFVIVQMGEGGSDPQSAGAAGDGAEVDALIVTAQKREEDIQDVPIAISAFTQEALEEQKIEGGFDLLKAVPNVTFSKNNFSSYNFSIRGVGTKAVSVTTDPGVAVEFNGTPIIRNRLFEQEYFDVERVEVLRGPQGTLHGRNATAGVINVISSKADLDEFSGWIKGEVGNYHAKRLSAVVNVPLANDVLGLRLAGALTSRDGYDFNSVTNNPVNGRELWSARLSLGFQPIERLRADFVWERFEEDDNRSRTGKQLCHRDPGLSQVGSVAIPDEFRQAFVSQGCKAGSLYDDNAFGTPNGISIPFILASVSQPATTADNIGNVGFDRPILVPHPDIPDFFIWDPEANYMGPIKRADPYGGMMQSRDLRTIASFRDPIYRAKADIFELNISYDISDTLSAYSQTAYVQDDYYSFQDYNRFNTVPIFEDTSTAWDAGYVDGVYQNIPSPLRGIAPGGVYCDPQLGCSNTLAGFDISQAKSDQFSQEFRLQSDFDGPFNFGVGANYLRYRTLEDYYVFFNLITMFAQIRSPISNESADINECRGQPMGTPETAYCIYIDPNPIESIDGEGHNYYRSKNPYRLSSYGVFGEAYWQFNERLKLTAGLRYTDDRKTATPVPTQVLLSSNGLSGGYVSRGYPSLPDIEQDWQAISGRLGFDWTPEVSFTDQTMVYGFYSHGYKGGGANPPGIGYYTSFVDADFYWVKGASFPATFEPEYVDAFEIGAKNTLMGGAMVLNAGAFFYDYTDYQVSKIVDRTAINENFDAQIWGLEFEGAFSPTKDLRFNATVGYQDTKIADGERSIDLMNRTQSNPDHVLSKPYVLQTSNCVVSVEFFELIGTTSLQYCPGFILSYPDDFYRDYFTEEHYPNGGQGFYADLSDNELPNAPHWTVSLGSQYSQDVLDGSWRVTVRGDAYWQSQSWARVYNAVNDKLHGWYNVNLSLWIERPEDDLKIELYAKNLLDKTPITDAFINSDDTALTTNVFVLDPRLIGLSIRKGF